jgi:hypothetical protein
MKLTRLRLLGFKSFVEPTDFLIEPGLPGVLDEQVRKKEETLFQIGRASCRERV